jgi:hypothetical protein
MTNKYFEGSRVGAERRAVVVRTDEQRRRQIRAKRKLAQPVMVRFDETLLLEYLNSRPESKEIDALVSQIEASSKRSRKTQKEIARLRQRNQSMLAKL